MSSPPSPAAPSVPAPPASPASQPGRASRFGPASPAMPAGPAPEPPPIPNLLSIAGTDPTGGAGIQTDLKVFGALGGYGMAVITAVIAQNTRRVQRICPVEPAMVGEQLDCVFEDVRVDAVKIGMVGQAAIAAEIAQRLARYRPPFVVFDPVMIASSRQRLMDAGDLEQIRHQLLPHVSLLTPNLPEAAMLLGIAEPRNQEDMAACLPGLHALGVENVLLKGGHLAGAQAIDLLSTPAGVISLASARIDTRHGHGTGCTLSSAIAALWPRHGLEQGVRLARAYLHEALQQAGRLEVGHGSGPLHHFCRQWP